MFASVRIQPSNVGALAEFLDIAFSLSAIFPCIRRLQWIGSSSWNAAHLGAFRDILAALGRLRTVKTLAVIDWDSVQRDALESIFHIAHISSLELKNVQFSSEGDFLAFLAQFDGIRNTHFENVHLDGLVPSLTCFTLPSGLCTVALRGSGAALEKDVSWTLSEDNCLTTEGCLNLIRMGAHTALSIEASSLLKGLGAQLHELEIISGCKCLLQLRSP
jgi:hypothetical protein